MLYKVSFGYNIFIKISNKLLQGGNQKSKIRIYTMVLLDPDNMYYNEYECEFNRS